MKTALVYDRVNKWGGAERVLLALHEMFPKAPLYTSVYNSQTAPWAKVFSKVIPSFLQKIPFAKTNHELLAPLMPIAFETFDFSGFDLVISVTSEATKGIIVRPPTKHICYCLTPTRYLWSHYGTYFKGGTFKGVMRPVVNYLRHWDKIAAQRPDKIIAISTAVQKRIEKYYGRDSEIVYPPVDVDKFRVSKVSNVPKVLKAKYFLVVSRLVSYKKVDLVIKAFNKLDLPLVIVGTGRQEKKLKKMAKSNIEFVSNLTDKELINYYRGAWALIMVQEEDFGIVAVEAQAAGIPIIAYNKGGSFDTVVEGKTGVFFDKQSPKSLLSAIERFDKIVFNKIDLVSNAKKFSKKRFRKEFYLLIDQFI